MKINDVLGCINKALVEERKIKNLPEVLGHFVFHISWERRMGTVKTFSARIDFINISKGISIPVISDSYSIECPLEKLEEVKEGVTIGVLEKFFILLRLGKDTITYETFINGTFEG